MFFPDRVSVYVLNKLFERVTVSKGEEEKKTKLFSQSVEEEINQTRQLQRSDNNDPADENEWQYYGK